MKTVLYLVCSAIFLNLVFLGTASAKEGENNSILRHQQLKKDSVATNSLDSIWLRNGIDRTKIQSINTIQNIISFKIDESSLLKLPAKFNASIKVKIYLYNASGGVDSTTFADLEMVLNYDSAAAYTAKKLLTFTNAHKVSVKILSDLVTDAGIDVTPALMLENEIRVQYDYTFNCTTDVLTAVNSVTPTEPVYDEVEVMWGNLAGADEYDLEWTYIDLSALNDPDNYGPSGAWDAARIFENNTSRVTTAANGYKIPLLYNEQGILFYRVRPVQVKAEDQRVEGEWSSKFRLDRFEGFPGHETGLNWQATTSFAENGKRKTVVQYFDGSLRNRQTVTKDNSNGTTIVAETKYNKQGQPAIQVLPAPTLNTIISYSRNFNTGYNNSFNEVEYNSSMFDTVMYNECTPATPTMISYSGASRYYSLNNPLANQSYNRFIPDANGYPFTVTEYTKDRTGRIAKQSGVGEMHTLGSSHETTYYYDAPTQKELDGLFGVEVGDASHYFKNTVRDANGQYSVAYVDMHGRTIATALAGKPAAKLDLLESNKSQVITDRLITADNNATKGLTMEASKSLHVTQAGDHRFLYKLTPQTAKIYDKEGKEICYDCLYDLEIVISGDCIIDAPITIKRSNIKIDADCNNAPFQYQADVDTTVLLQEGSYMITKRLTVNRQALEKYRDSIFLAHNLARTEESYINTTQSVIASVTGDKCVLTCSSCDVLTGNWNEFRFRYMLAAGYISVKGYPLVDTALYGKEVLRAYNELKGQCDLICGRIDEEYESIRSIMLADMTPGAGQYAQPDQVNTIYSIFYKLPFFIGRHKYQNPSIPDTAGYASRASGGYYVDENGKKDTVLNAMGQPVLPQSLTIAEFLSNFKPSWALSLLYQHPEYAKLKKLEEFKASNIWDNMVQKQDTFARAKAYRYLNPTNANRTPFTTFSPYVANTVVDPFYLSPVGTSYRANIENRLSAFKISTGFPIQVLSMWSAATIMSACKDNNAACTTLYKNVQNAFSNSLCEADLNMAWKQFRNLYLAEKQKIRATEIQRITVTVPAGKIPRFFSGFDSVSKYIADGNAPNTVNYEDSLRKNYKSNCEAYANKWIEQLGTCGFNWQTDSAKIISDLVNVCAQASNASHPYGASNIPTNLNPVLPNRFRSFEEVINFYRRPGVSALNCNSYLITAPAAYEKPKAIADQVLLQPDPCVCQKVNEYFDLYNANQKGRTFQVYLKEEWNITLSVENANNLLSACPKTPVATSCNNVLKPLVVPPAFQCGAVKPCVPCNEVKQLYSKFTTTFGTVALNYNEEDSAQQYRNTLFGNYMNHQLGFNKSSLQYLQFMDSCNTVYYAGNYRDSLAMEALIDKSLNPQLEALFANVSGDSLRSVVDRFKQVYNSMQQCGDGLTFNGSTSRVTIPYKNEKLNFGRGEFTMEINFRTPYSPGFTTFLSKRSTLEPTGVFGYLGDYFNADGFLLGAFNGQTPFIQLAGTPNLVPLAGLNINLYDGNYHHLALTRRSDTISFFVDGIRVGLPNPTGLVNRNLSNAGSMNIGYDVINQSGFTGTIREVRFWNVARTDDQIRNNINQVLAQQAGLVGYYRMKDSVGAQVITDGSVTCITERNDALLGETKLAESSDPVWVPTGFQCFKELCKPAYIKYFNNHFNTCLSYEDAELLYLNKVRKLFDGCGTQGLSCDKLKMIEANYLISRGYVLPVSPNCDTASFVNFFNQSTFVHANYNYPQIAMMYFSNCGKLPAICRGDTTTRFLTLCGAAPAFAVDTTKEPDACANNLAFAVMRGSEEYKLYKQTLLGNFEDIYLSKCLNAYQFEDFTVTRERSEYHYTLYYYDQAGNLVKTVPPQGVDLSKAEDDVWLAKVAAARRNKVYDTDLLPLHGLETQYSYNTLNQVTNQKTPDAGVSEFWYDRLGRLAVSRNAKQQLNNQYSYTKYDGLGRITEVGQSTNASSTQISADISRKPADLIAWLNGNAVKNEQITQTVYDLAYQPVVSAGVLVQKNLRNRVSFTRLIDKYTTDITEHNNATFYSYDIHGNVTTLLQDFQKGIMNDNSGNRFKRMDYKFDLISGKVNKVLYQAGQKDQFIHQYEYDAENRITDVRTSRDGIVWEHDAFYQYYLHGPLARTVLGDQQVQGIDYAYTIQGWLKGVNSTALNPDLDMGEDGKPGAQQSQVARDAFAFGLHYFEEGRYDFWDIFKYASDYKPVNPNYRPFANPGYAVNNHDEDSQPQEEVFGSLYNGNIAAMTVNISKFKQPMLYSYGYDQLNRLKKMDAYTGMNETLNSWVGAQKQADYHEEVKYDANGNIASYLRNGHGSNLPMDNLQYGYNKDVNGRLVNNRLRSVQDLVTTSAAEYNDIKSGQSADNYQYDAIGNLTSDEQEGIKEVKWNVYGKIENIRKEKNGAITDIAYGYDASGNRISKTSNGITTWYVRDASGNVMGTYVKGDNNIQEGRTSLTELNLYGSSRLGMLKLDINMTTTGTDVQPIISLSSNYKVSDFKRGEKFFELSNHLGNVLTTISDKKIGVDESGDGMNEYYVADVMSANDYYPFGMTMTGRSSSSDIYRYGFNGKEKSDEIKGEGNAYDYGARMYDTRLGRWLSADPRKDKYTSWSPFHFGFDNPITTIDPNGEENIVVVGAQHDNAAGNKLMFVHQGLRQLKEYSQNEKDESRSLVIFTQGYTPRQLKRIEEQAAKLGATVVKVSSAEQLTNYVNTKNPNGLPTPAREADKVTNIDAFSHGVVAAIEFGYQINAGDKTNTTMTFNSASAEKLDKKAFADGAVFASYACRTGLGNAEISALKYPWESTKKDESLAQDISNSAGIMVKAYQVRSDYANTLSSFQDRLYLKLYEKTGMGTKRKETIEWYKKWQERLKQRENIDGATFDPQGAVHPVEGGTTPTNVDSDQKTFTPKK